MYIVKYFVVYSAYNLVRFYFNLATYNNAVINIAKEFVLFLIYITRSLDSLFKGTSFVR